MPRPLLARLAFCVIEAWNRPGAPGVDGVIDRKCACPAGRSSNRIWPVTVVVALFSPAPPSAISPSVPVPMVEGPSTGVVVAPNRYS